MKFKSREKAFLVLEDGKVFEGYAIGKIGTTTGELCFNTGMTGYQEIYTDPSYYKQIIVNTNVHIGNYGINKDEQESASVKFSGLVCKTYSFKGSRYKSDQELEEYLVEANIVGISDIDTRAVVKYIRDKGAMNAIVSSENQDTAKLLTEVKKVPSMAGLELSSEVSTKEPYFYGEKTATYKVAVLDLGIKTSILKYIAQRDTYCKVFPAHTSFEEMKKWGADGYFVSNGPGDPSATTYAVETVKNILAEDRPLFGICLGHQIIALANGISTYKMFNGHRGLNHPVKNLITGKSEITSQNHGFSIKKEDVEASDVVEATHVNLNDDTIEGIRIKGKKAFSVQHHPESSPGPHDSRYLFDDFVKLFNN